MKVFRGPHSDWVPMVGGTAVTVGVFDGVHLGHQAALRRLKELSGGRPTVVATFDPHPAVVLAPEHAPRLLTTPEQRVRVFETLGLGAVAFLAFDDEMRAMRAERFIADVLVGALGAEVIVVGSDFQFGFERAGDVAMLERSAATHGYEFEAVELFGEGEPISSTAIRKLLSAGKLDAAQRLLGRPYAVEGVVVSGAGRGAALGFSTANLGLDLNQYLPQRGVYAAFVTLQGRRFPGVCNVGVRPTFGESAEVIEVHLLGFEGDISGETVEIEFNRRIRDEKTFAGPGDLAAQVRRDIDRAAEILGSGGG